MPALLMLFDGCLKYLQSMGVSYKSYLHDKMRAKLTVMY